MKNINIPFRETGKFSSLFLSYIEGSLPTSSFYTEPFQKESFPKILNQYNDFDRISLVEVLNAQHADLTHADKVKENISKLNSPQTFTITTGHQLNLFTGPLFFVFKILSTIRLCEELKKSYPQHDFVPVYWMATEDHDFEEINHFTLFGKTHTWDSDQKGAVGRFGLQEIQSFLDQLPDDLACWKTNYQNGINLADATRKLVHTMFYEYGLIILDADDVKLKKKFQSVIQEECFGRKSLSVVERNTQALEELGFKGQIFPRSINLFYLIDQVRERIVEEEGVFKVLNTKIEFSEIQLKSEIDQYPERFSPNVVLRPVYQQLILPNLGYIGGPAELVYWLQIKPVFDLYNAVFPVLVPRAFGVLVQNHIQQKVAKLGFSYLDLFSSLDQLKKDFVAKTVSTPLEFENEKSFFTHLQEELNLKAQKIDPTLIGFIGAELKKVEKSLESIEKRLKKAEENQFEKELKQLENVYQKLFPNGGLMERSENIFSFLVNEPKLLKELHGLIDPFETSFNVFLHD